MFLLTFGGFTVSLVYTASFLCPGCFSGLASWCSYGDAISIFRAVLTVVPYHSVGYRLAAAAAATTGTPGGHAGDCHADLIIMTRLFALIIGLLYYPVLLVANVITRGIGQVAYWLLVSVNLCISIFVVSYFRLRRSWYGVISWDGSYIVLSYRRGNLLAMLGAQHANAFVEPEETFGRFAIWLYGVHQETSKPQMASLIMNPGGMYFYKLKTFPTHLSAAESELSNVMRTTGEEPQLRKSKSVTFNENVEVHLITSSHIHSHQSRYLASRYNFLNTFSLIPANTIVQQY